MMEPDALRAFEVDGDVHIENRLCDGDHNQYEDDSKQNLGERKAPPIIQECDQSASLSSRFRSWISSRERTASSSSSADSPVMPPAASSSRSAVRRSSNASSTYLRKSNP